MPTKRFDNIDPERRRKILDAAQVEFSQNGFGKASLNRIIEAAGISKGSLYYYFEDKTDLYLTVLENVVLKVFNKLGGIAAGEFTDDFWSDWENYCKKTAHFSYENPDIVSLYRELLHLSRNQDMSHAVNEFINKGKVVFTEIIQHGQEIGAVRKDISLDLLVNILFSMGEAIDYWMIERWDEFSPEEIEKTVLLYTDMCRKIAGSEAVKGG